MSSVGDSIHETSGRIPRNITSQARKQWPRTCYTLSFRAVSSRRLRYFREHWAHPKIKMQIRERRFLISTEPFYLGLWSSFVALWTTRSPAVSKSSGYLFRSVGARRFELSGKSLIGSIVLHGAAILLLLSIPHTPVATPN